MREGKNEQVNFAIVHIGKGKTAARPIAAFVDPTISAPMAPQRAKLPPRIVSERMAALLDVLRRPTSVARSYRPVSLLKVRDGQCKYIASAIICCGRKTEPGSSWCDYHAAIVFAGYSKDFAALKPRSKALRQADSVAQNPCTDFRRLITSRGTVSGVPKIGITEGPP